MEVITTRRGLRVFCSASLDDTDGGGGEELLGSDGEPRPLNMPCLVPCSFGRRGQSGSLPSSQVAPQAARFGKSSPGIGISRGSQDPQGRVLLGPVSSAFQHMDWSVPTAHPPMATWGLQWPCRERPSQLSPQPHAGRGGGPLLGLPVPHPLAQGTGLHVPFRAHSRLRAWKSFLPRLQGAAGSLDIKLSC